MGGGVRFDAREAAYFLVRRALSPPPGLDTVVDVEIAANIVGDLERLLSIRTAPCLDCLSLHSIGIDGRASIDDRLHMVPLLSLPPSEPQRWIEGGPASTSQASSVPTAIVRRSLVEPVFAASREELPKARSADELYEAAVPLTLLCESAVWPGPRWAHNEDPLLHAASGISCGVDTLPLEIVTNTGTFLPEEVDASDVGRIVSAYRGLSESFRPRMHLSLTRFGRAKRRLELEDKALDLMMRSIVPDAQGRYRGKHLQGGTPRRS